MKHHLRSVEVERLIPNTWNFNEQDDKTFQANRKSIRHLGFLDPVTARRTDRPGADYEILDGEHRWLAAKAEGLAAIPVYDLGVVSDAVAIQITATFNENRGRPDALRLSMALRKARDLGVDAAQLGSILPYTADEMDRMLRLADPPKVTPIPEPATEPTAVTIPERAAPPPPAHVETLPPVGEPPRPDGKAGPATVTVEVTGGLAAIFERAMEILRERYPGLKDAEILVDAVTKSARGP